MLLPMKVLLVEDEPKIAEFVCAGLAARGVSVTHVADGRQGLALARQPSWGAIVLDIMLPGRDGLEILQDLRAEGVPTPVLLLTARNELGDRVRGLELGADDYLAKPFFVEELAARLQALQRRLAGERQSLLQVGPLVLDRIARQVRCGSQEVDLTAREFGLLECLMRSPGQVLTRRQLLESVWGHDFDPSTNVVDVCVKRIRGKFAALEAGDENLAPIDAVRGLGYRLRPPQ